MKAIPIAQPAMGEEERNNLVACVNTGWISSAGPFITAFEQDFARYSGAKYALAVSNGTAALHLALLAAGVGSGDEVILPALTYVSSANAISYTGATPVFVDIDPVTWTMDPQRIRHAISARTKAIMPVHLYGYPADMNAVHACISKSSRRIFVIEDAAEAHGATLSVATPALSAGAQVRVSREKTIWKKVGAIGDIGCFSFYGNKIITTGEGGMVVSNSKRLIDTMKMLRDHGSSPKHRYHHPVVGFNYRMTNMQAGVGVAQLTKIDRFLRRRQQIDRLYRRLLHNVPGIVLPPSSTADKHGVCWIFSMLITPGFGMSRDRLMEALGKRGIETRPFFIPLPLLPMYSSRLSYPVAEKVARSGLSLPTYVDLPDEDIHTVARSIGKAQTG